MMTSIPDDLLEEMTNIAAGYSLSNSFILKSIVDDPEKVVASSVGERKLDKSLAIGTQAFEFNMNGISNIEDIISFDRIQNNDIQIPRVISIDSSIIKNDNVIDFLRRISSIKPFDLNIVGDNYVLTQEDYDKLSFAGLIQVEKADNITINNDTKTGVLVNNGFFTVDYDLASDSDEEREVFFVNRVLDDGEIKSLVDILNGEKNFKPELSLRFYEPDKYIEFLTKLKAAGLSDNVDISLLGYPLTDGSDFFKKVNDTLDNHVDVIYSSCHDMLKLYSNPPYYVNNSFYSALEPGSKTGIENYVRILEYLENFETRVADYDNDLDKMVSAYNFLQENYIYDPDYEQTDSDDYRTNRNLESIVGRQKIVCAGYANLLSIMLRRNGVPVFTDPARSHLRNFARIKVKNPDGTYSEDKICSFDATFDRIKPNSGENENTRNFTYFGVSPDKFFQSSLGENIGIANSLTLNRDEYNRYHYVGSNFNSASRSFPFDVRGYSFTALRLMGYDFDPFNKGHDFFDFTSQLVEDGKIGDINPSLIRDSFKRVMMHEKNISEEEFERVYGGEFDISMSLRDYSFDLEPKADITLGSIFIDGKDASVLVNPTTVSPVEHKHIDIEEIDPLAANYLMYGGLGSKKNSTNKEQVTIENEEILEVEENDDTFGEEDFSEEFISGTTIRRPRGRGIYETDEDYVSFLEKYYSHYFPTASKNSSVVYGMFDDGTYRLDKEHIIQDMLGENVSVSEETHSFSR